jgi:hypothetical protein
VVFYGNFKQGKRWDGYGKKYDMDGKFITVTGVHHQGDEFTYLGNIVLTIATWIFFLVVLFWFGILTKKRG